MTQRAVSSALGTLCLGGKKHGDKCVREHGSTSALGPLETSEDQLDVKEIEAELEKMSPKCEDFEMESGRRIHLSSSLIRTLFWFCYQQWVLFLLCD